LVGFGFQAPSMPLVVVCTPLPVPSLLIQPRPMRFDRRAFGFGADQLGIACAVRLAEGVAAGDQRHGLLVVHRHAREGLAHVAAGGHRVGVAVRAFGVHVDQAHLHGGQRVLQLALAA
jgi:hypothetical protein